MAPRKRNILAPRRRAQALLPAALLALLLLLLAPARHGAASLLPADQGSAAYAQAREHFLALQKDAQGSKRDNWLRCAESFRGLAQGNTGPEVGVRARFMLARTFLEMYSRFALPADLAEAEAAFESVADLFPDHFLADDALFALASIHARDHADAARAARIHARIVALYPGGDMAAAAARELEALKRGEAPAAPPAQAARLIEPGASKTARAQQEMAAPGRDSGRAARAAVLPIRHWSNNRYTRVVVETSGPVPFKHNILDGGNDQQRRLYIDLGNSRLGAEVPPSVPIEDGLLRRVRSAQFDSDTVRVVLDTQTAIADYKVFSLDDPFRVVIDVRSQDEGKTPAGGKTTAGRTGSALRRIVIDPGHGGKDPGAISPSGLQEKDIVLQVALMVAARLRENPNYEVTLTRERDVFVPLEERTAIANARDADLFLSIHVNAAPNRQARGIETYVLDLTNDKEAMRLAALENASSSRQIDQLQSILQDLMHNSKLNESVKLAEMVQEEMVEGLGRSQPGINNLGVKKAPFVVLVGAQMPAVLTEVGFLSNEKEEARLRDARYLTDLAAHIASGVSRYADNLSFAAGSFR